MRLGVTVANTVRGLRLSILALGLVWSAGTLGGQNSEYEQAASLAERGDHARALPILERLLSQSPRDLKVLNLTGIMLTAAGRPSEANRYFEQAIDLNPQFYPALKNLAVNELRLGRVDEARLHFEAALKLIPQDPVVHFGLGEIELAVKNYGQAGRHYEQSGDFPYRDQRATYNLALCYVESGQTHKAVAALEKLPASADAEVRFAAGMLLARVENYKAAAAQFAGALPRHPDPYLVAFNLVLAQLKAGDFPAAVAAGEKLVAEGHRTGEIYNLLSEAYEGNRETLKAYEALRTATEIEPRNETNYLDLITLCLEHQNYDLGLEIADIGLRVVPESDRLRLHRGVVLAMRGQFPEAQQEFETVGKQSSQPGLSHVALSLVLMQAGEIDQAVTILRQRRLENQNDHLALWFLAEALIRRGAVPGSEPENEAVECLERSIQLSPNLAQTRTLLGKTLLGRGEIDRAEEQLEKALEIDSEDITATYQLARVKQRKGDRERAQELFAKVSKAKEEDRDGFTQGGLLRIVRQGSN